MPSAVGGGPCKPPVGEGAAASPSPCMGVPVVVVVVGGVSPGAVPPGFQLPALPPIWFLFISFLISSVGKKRHNETRPPPKTRFSCVSVARAGMFHLGSCQSVCVKLSAPLPGPRPRCNSKVDSLFGLPPPPPAPPVLPFPFHLGGFRPNRKTAFFPPALSIFKKLLERNRGAAGRVSARCRRGMVGGFGDLVGGIRGRRWDPWHRAVS